MLAHFVGGHRNGDDEVISGHPAPTIKTVELNCAPAMWPMYALDERRGIYELPNFIEHTYRLLWNDDRVAIYKWQAPKVEGSFQFAVAPGRPHDRGRLLDTLRDMTQRSSGESVQVTSVEYQPDEVHVRGVLLVDGPPDAQAAKEASAAVHALIERKLRNYVIVGFAVDVQGG